jgi:hypothetical protein
MTNWSVQRVMPKRQVDALSIASSRRHPDFVAIRGAAHEAVRGQDRRETDESHCGTTPELEVLTWETQGNPLTLALKRYFNACQGAFDIRFIFFGLP